MDAETYTIKLAIFWIGVFFFVPLGIIGCRSFSWFRHVIFSMLVLSLIFSNSLSISFFTTFDPKVISRGIEITLSDLCAIILFADILLGRKNIKWLPPITVPQCVFILIAIASWAQIEKNLANPVYITGQMSPDDLINRQPIFHLLINPWIEITKLLRGLLLFWVSVNFFREAKEIILLRRLLAVFAFYFAGLALYQRYVLHITRVNALGHTNVLASFVTIIGGFIFPWIFQSKRLLESFTYTLAILCITLTLLFTASRSGLAGFVLVLIIGTPIALLRFMSFRNLILVGLGCFSLLGMGIKAFDTLAPRFGSSDTESSYAIRENLMDAAIKMANDFPLGVGMGNFGAWSVLKYSREANAEEGNIAHNSFYLTLGELGYLGLASFIFIFIRLGWIILATFTHRAVWHDTLIFAAVLGVLLAFTGLLPQLLFQFAYRVTPVYFVCQILLGLGVRLYLDSRKQPATRL